MLLVLLRFAAIGFMYTSEVFYQNFLHVEYVNSSKVVESTKNRLEDFHSQNRQLVSQKEQSFFEKMSSGYDKLKSHLDISKRLDSLKTSIENSTRKIVSLITIFAVQSVIMPLLFLWLLVISIKAVFGVQIDKKSFEKLISM